MVSKTNGKTTTEKMESEGATAEDGYMGLFAVASQLKERFGDQFRNLPTGAIKPISWKHFPESAFLCSMKKKLRYSQNIF